MEKKFVITMIFPMKMDKEVLDRVNRIIKAVLEEKLNPLIKIEVSILEEK